MYCVLSNLKCIPVVKFCKILFHCILRDNIFVFQYLKPAWFCKIFKSAHNMHLHLNFKRVKLPWEVFWGYKVLVNLHESLFACSCMNQYWWKMRYSVTVIWKLREILSISSRKTRYTSFGISLLNSNWPIKGLRQNLKFQITEDFIPFYWKLRAVDNVLL